MPIKTLRAALLESSDPLAPVASLAGGTWVGEGKWPDGSILKVEQRYFWGPNFWGPTKRVLHFETYDLASGERHLLYDRKIRRMAENPSR